MFDYPQTQTRKLTAGLTIGVMSVLLLWAIAGSDGCTSGACKRTDGMTVCLQDPVWVSARDGKFENGAKAVFIKGNAVAFGASIHITADSSIDPATGSSKGYMVPLDQFSLEDVRGMKVGSLVTEVVKGHAVRTNVGSALLMRGPDHSQVEIMLPLTKRSEIHGPTLWVTHATFRHWRWRVPPLPTEGTN